MVDNTVADPWATIQPVGGYITVLDFSDAVAYFTNYIKELPLICSVALDVFVYLRNEVDILLYGERECYTAFIPDHGPEGLSRLGIPSDYSHDLHNTFSNLVAEKIYSVTGQTVSQLYIMRWLTYSSGVIYATKPPHPRVGFKYGPSRDAADDDDTGDWI